MHLRTCLLFVGLAFPAVFPLLLPAATPITPVPPQATRRVATGQVRVAPDHRDWTYQLGEPARFRIMVTADNEPIDAITVRYTVGPELMPSESKTAVLPLDGLVIEGGTMQVPGFIRCAVETKVAGKIYKGAGTAAYAPERIMPLQTEPDDFDEFWQRGRSDLASVPLEAKLTLLPEACTATVNVYHVGVRTIGEGWTAFGGGRRCGLQASIRSRHEWPGW